MSFPAKTRLCAALLAAAFALIASEGRSLPRAGVYPPASLAAGTTSERPASKLLADPPIFMRTVPEHITAGEPFWLEILAGTPGLPVQDLFGISFEVRYSNQEIITIPSPDSSAIMPGDFPGGDVIFLGIAERDSGRVGVGLTRKQGSGGVTGSGVVARIRIQSDQAAPDSLPIQFVLENIRAQKENGDPIQLTQQELNTVLFQREDFLLTVEPEVQQVQQGTAATWEVLLTSVGRFSRPVSLSFEALPAGFTSTIMPQTIRPAERALITLIPDSSVAPGSYDLRLSGTADTLKHQAVVRARVVTTPLFMSTQADVIRSGEPFRLLIHAGEASRPVTDLATLKVTVRAANSLYLQHAGDDPQAIRLEDFAGEAFVLNSDIAADSGHFHISLQKKAGAEPVSGFGPLFSLEFSTDFTTPDSTVIDFELVQVQALNSRGEPLILTPEPYQVVIHEKLDFSLHVEPEERRLIAGERTSFVVRMATSYSFSDTVALKLDSPVPAGMKIFFLPDNIRAGTTAQMMVFSDSTTVPGRYELRLSGRSSRQQKSAAGVVDVLPFIDFDLVLTPDSREIAGSGESRFHVSIESENTLRRPVTLSLETTERSRVRLSLDRDQIGLDEVAVLNVQVDEGAETESIAFRVLGRSENVRRFVDGQIVILPPPSPVRPNPFTPNGDGFNDEVIFDFDQLRSGQQGRIRIFTLDGRKIHDFSGRMSWDGRDENGRDVNPGAYLYIVEVGQKVIARGVIGLAR